jgi:hypothetical protein
METVQCREGTKAVPELMKKKLGHDGVRTYTSTLYYQVRYQHFLVKGEGGPPRREGWPNQDKGGRTRTVGLGAGNQGNQLCDWCD